MTSDAISYLKKLEEIQNGTTTQETIFKQSPDEEKFIINADTREISVPSSFSNIGVIYDHNAETIFFKIPRYFDNVDLNDHTCIIQYINAGKEEDIYTVTQKDLSNDGEIIFGWKITNSVTKYAGSVSFAVRFYSITNRVFDYNFNTKVAQFNVLNGLNVTANNININPDILSQWIEKINALDNIELPMRTSELINDSSFLSIETDPTVPKWAKQSEKPTYTASEVGAVEKSGGAISETIVDNLETIETKFPIPTAGETIKRFLGKVMTFLTNIKPLESNVARYVSSTAGSDGTGDGSSIKPFRTIQRALDSIPYDLNSYSASIYVADGSYSGFKIKGFYNGALLVTGNTTNATLVDVKLSSPTYVRETTATIEVSGFYFNGFENTAASFCVGVINATRVSIHHCTINGGTSGIVKNHGILSHSCNLAAYNCEFNNCARCVFSDHSTATPPANTKVWANTGIGNDTTYYCYGGTISLGGGTVPQSSGGNSIGNGGVIVNKYGGSIGTLSSNTTLYVSTTGDDVNGSGTSTAPYKTIQHALNTLPKNLSGYAAYIQVADGVYNEEVIVNGFYGGIIEIKSQSSPESLNIVCKIRRIAIKNCPARIQLYGIYFTQTNDIALDVNTCNIVYVRCCQAVEPAEASSAFSFMYTSARLSGCKSLDHLHCARAFMSNVSSENWSSSSAVTYGISADTGGKISKVGAQPTGIISNEYAVNGGTIIESNGTQLLNITKTGLACTWGTIGGGYNKHGNCNAAMVTIQTKITLSSELTANTEYVISGFPNAALDTACTCSNQSNTINCYIDTAGQLKYKPLNGNTSGAVISFNCTYLTVA